MQNFIIANCTDVGMQRQVNEDSMTTFDSPNGQVVVVCDGMGGQAAGDVASRLACDVIRDLLENNTFGSPMEAITRGMVAANTVILNRTAANPELEGMGSTCVMLIIKNGQVYYGWVGDSRIYYFSNGQLQQVSRDQSYVQQLVDAGQLTPEEAEHHPQKNEITNALGVPNMTPPELSAVPVTPEEGAIMMLCSDGLSGMVPAATIQQVLGASNMSLQEKAEHLVSLANAAGGVDNITVQLVEFKPVAASSQRIETPPAAVVAARRSNNMIRSVMIGAIVVVLLLVAAFYIFRREDPKTPTAESGSTEQVVHKKTPQQVTKTTTVVYEEKNVTTKSQPAKSSTSKPKSTTEQVKGKVSGGSTGKTTTPKTPSTPGTTNTAPKTTTNPAAPVKKNNENTGNTGQKTLKYEGSGSPDLGNK